MSVFYVRKILLEKKVGPRATPREKHCRYERNNNLIRSTVLSLHLDLIQLRFLFDHSNSKPGIQVIS